MPAIVFAALLLPGVEASAQRTATTQGGAAAYHRVHRDAVVADGHNDILGRVIDGDRVDVLSKKGQSDFVRFREGGLDVQIFSVWVPEKYGNTEAAYDYANREIDSLEAIVGRLPSKVAIVRSGAELERTVAAGKLAAIIGLEGGHPIDASRDKLLALYRRGLRNFGLTWNNSTSWASSARDESEGRVHPGLTPPGVTFIHLLDSLGVIIDVSHLGEKAFYDVLAATTHPIIASHSSCAALCANRRNLTDEQLRALAKNGGVAMINFYPLFIRTDASKAMAKFCNEYNRRIAARRGPKGWTAAGLARRDALVREAVSKGLPTIYDVADHIDHAIQVAGIDHVGIGSDFDGIDFTPVGLGDVSMLPLLTRELLRRGHRPEEVRKVMGGNFVALFENVCR